MKTTDQTADAPASRDVAEHLLDFRAALEQQRQFRVEQLDDLAAAANCSHAAEGAFDEVSKILKTSALAALTEVEAALDRLHAGTFSVCERCAMRISNERLEILPMSRYCMRCQHALEMRPV
jgi:DnaK suppressor protein